MQVEFKDRTKKLTLAIERGVARGLDSSCDLGILIATTLSLPFVDTGSLRDSWYKMTPISDTFQQAAQRAKSLNPRAQIVPQPDRPIGSAPGPGRAVPGSAKLTTAVIGSVVGHAILNELGLGNIRDRRPMLQPAVKFVKKNMKEIIAKSIQEEQAKGGF